MGVFGFFSSLMIWEAGASTREAQQTRGGGGSRQRSSAEKRAAGRHGDSVHLLPLVHHGEAFCVKKNLTCSHGSP